MLYRPTGRDAIPVIVVFVGGLGEQVASAIINFLARLPVPYIQPACGILDAVDRVDREPRVDGPAHQRPRGPLSVVVFPLLRYVISEWNPRWCIGLVIPLDLTLQAIGKNCRLTDRVGVVEVAWRIVSS